MWGGGNRGLKGLVRSNVAEVRVVHYDEEASKEGAASNKRNKVRLSSQVHKHGDEGKNPA